jgi:hypothetical protein
MDINQVYSLTSGNFLDEICTVDNLFIRQLANLSSDGAKNLKVVSFVLKDKANKRGEIAKRNISPEDKSVIDICKLTPLVNGSESKNLLEEVAKYRSMTLNFDDVGPTFWKDNEEILMIDYLLSSCLCYVEIFDSTANVEKFFATRNRFIAGGIAGLKAEDTAKYVSYLRAYSVNYQSKQLKVLKLSANKSGMKIVQPRSFIDFNRNIKITPLFIMTSFVQGLEDTLRNQIVKFKYIKDNMTEREFITTLSPEILLTNYEETFVQKMMSGVTSQLIRGYVRLPELGISKYDASGVRALNISRITSVEVVNDFDKTFIDVDFETILPAFKETINNMRDTRMLALIHEDLTGQLPQTTSSIELRSTLVAFVDGQYALGTTTALRYIHNYMMSRIQFFPLYKGGKPIQYGSIGSSFNLGLVE